MTDGMGRGMNALRVPGLMALVDALIEGEFCDDRDRDDLVATTARWAETCGLIDASQREHAKSMADEGRKRAIIADYVALAKQTRSVSRRSAKIAALGINPSTLNHWARRLHGPGYLAQFGPPSATALVLEYVRRRPGSTRRQILAHSGVSPKSMPGALDWSLRRGRLRRERDDGERLWRWYANV